MRQFKHNTLGWLAKPCSSNFDYIVSKVEGDGGYVVYKELIEDNPDWVEIKECIFERILDSFNEGNCNTAAEDMAYAIQKHLGITKQEISEGLKWVSGSVYNERVAKLFYDRGLLVDKHIKI